MFKWLLNKNKGGVKWDAIYKASCEAIFRASYEASRKGHMDFIKFLYRKNIIRDYVSNISRSCTRW